MTFPAITSRRMSKVGSPTISPIGLCRHEVEPLLKNEYGTPLVKIVTALPPIASTTCCGICLVTCTFDLRSRILVHVRRKEPFKCRIEDALL